MKLAAILLLCGVASAQLSVMGGHSVAGGHAILGSSGAIAINSFSLVQSFPTTPAFAGGTTVSLTLAQSLAAGQLVVFECRTTNPVNIVSANVGGTVIPVYSVNSGNLNTLFPAVGYITSATSTAGPIVLTFSGATGAPATCYARVAANTFGTAQLDLASSQLLTSQTTPVTGQTVSTLSGTNDFMVEDNNTDYANTTAVSGTGWTANAKFDATDGPGWAVKLNSITSTAPSWTLSAGPGNANPTVLAFAVDGTPCSDYSYIDFEGGSDTTTMTTALLDTSQVGYPRTGSNNGWALSTTPATGITFSTAAQLGPLHTNRRTCGDGATHTGSGSLGFRYDYSNNVNKTVNFNFYGNGSKASVGFFFQTSMTTSTNEDVMGFVPNLSNAAVALQFHNGTLRIECFGGSVTTSQIAAISSNTKYWVSIGIDTAVGGSGAVYETVGWTQLGTATCSPGGWTATPPNSLRFGRTGGTADTPAATVFMDNAILDASGAFPVLP